MAAALLSKGAGVNVLFKNALDGTQVLLANHVRSFKFYGPHTSRNGDGVGG